MWMPDLTGPVSTKKVQVSNSGGHLAIGPIPVESYVFRVTVRFLQEGLTMLSTSQKAQILSKVGIAVPPFPSRRFLIEDRYLERGSQVLREEFEADEEQRAAALAWTADINTRYAAYVTERALRSLHGTHEAEQVARLTPPKQ